MPLLTVTDRFKSFLRLLLNAQGPQQPMQALDDLFPVAQLYPADDPTLYAHRGERRFWAGGQLGVGVAQVGRLWMANPLPGRLVVIDDVTLTSTVSTQYSISTLGSLSGIPAAVAGQQFVADFRYAITSGNLALAAGEFIQAFESIAGALDGGPVYGSVANTPITIRGPWVLSGPTLGLRIVTSTPSSNLAWHIRGYTRALETVEGRALP